MRIRNIRNAKLFFDAVLKCKGSVELRSAQGDCLNMKSTLCQYLALTQLFDEGEVDLELVLSEPEEYSLLSEYIIV